MLKGIPSILSPDLLKILMKMGHGDEICIGDGNFPHTSRNIRQIRCDGLLIPPLLEAILSLMPLDSYDPKPVTLMAVLPGDSAETPIWDEYRRIIKKADPRGSDVIQAIERPAFLEKAKTCFAIVATGEPALYANIILKKGIIRPLTVDKTAPRLAVDFREE